MQMSEAADFYLMPPSPVRTAAASRALPGHIPEETNADTGPASPLGSVREQQRSVSHARRPPLGEGAPGQQVSALGGRPVPYLACV